MKFLKYNIAAIMLAAAAAAAAQTPKVWAELDSMSIVIGGQVGMTVRASFPDTTAATFAQLADTLTADIEVVEALPVDTAIVNGVVTLQQRYILTSFDTGLHYIPPVEFLQISGAAAAASEPMALNVLNPFQTIDVDEQSGVAMITDIRDAMDAPFLFAELYAYIKYILIGLLAVAVIVAGIVLYMRYGGKAADKPKKVKPSEPCHIVALRDLERIREEKLWQRNMFKEYYTQITDTLRQYIGSRFEMSAMESTTEEIMSEMQTKLPADEADLTRLREILQLADFVKFAKHEPLPDENDMAIKHAIEFVNGTMPQPENTEAKTEKGEEK